jgi:hypothetical protein
LSLKLPEPGRALSVSSRPAVAVNDAYRNWRR